jgi:hypothetical protein
MATDKNDDTSSRQSSVFEPPEYKIYYGPDHTLQWDPPAGSKELAVALSYHYPLGDLESKMRTVTKRFLKIEAKRYFEEIEERNTSSSEKRVLSEEGFDIQNCQSHSRITQTQNLSRNLLAGGFTRDLNHGNENIARTQSTAGQSQ